MTRSAHAESDALVDPIAVRQRDCLRATGLVKSFRGRKVVKGVAVEVYAGEVDCGCSVRMEQARPRSST